MPPGSACRSRAFASTAAVASLAALLPRPSRAAYPERPIRIIVPFPPGGALDGVARVLSKALMDNTGATRGDVQHQALGFRINH
jgi:tripartite-type tricarboxylate transporter receptor subunit TctC